MVWCNKYYELLILFYVIIRNFEVLFDFIGFEGNNIFKNYRMLWILCKLFYDIYTTDVDEVTHLHHSWVSNYRLRIQVVRKLPLNICDKT